MEFLVGLFFDKALGVILWTYSNKPFNIMGYICLQVSLIWCLLIFVVMSTLFPKLQEWFDKIPSKVASIITIISIILIIIDFVLSTIFCLV